jgi:hypothetical protein
MIVGGLVVAGLPAGAQTQADAVRVVVSALNPIGLRQSRGAALSGSESGPAFTASTDPVGDIVTVGAATSIDLRWSPPFLDTNYTVVCSWEEASVLVKAHHIELKERDAVTIVVSNTDPTFDSTGIGRCLIVHD